MIPIIERAYGHKKRKAIISGSTSFTYQDLLSRSEAMAFYLLQREEDLKETPVAFIVDPSMDYTTVQWGIWRAGGIAVPLHPGHPKASIEYVLEDTGCDYIIYDDKYQDKMSEIFPDKNITRINISEINWKDHAILPDIQSNRKAMILYTSGTTSKPKGVVTTHDNISFQVQSLVNAWQWKKEDHILNVLPMHHVHGIINVMSCALWSGACCEFLERFDAKKVWEKFTEGNVNLFMAVPTIYFKLIRYWDNAKEEEQKKLSESCQHFRLMVSGSAALPVPVLEKWRAISGMTLLERYGMTEIGMALSNPHNGERRPGHVGLPLPGVDIRLMDGNSVVIEEGVQGEIQVKGPNVFKEYWKKPEATQKAFTKDGWFMTGDIALVSRGYYKILGRDSVDIIKSGGYKISALEIEDVLRNHDQISECAVVGLPDEEWGEIVAASLITGGKEVNLDELHTWLKDRLPSYKFPRRIIFQKDLPRNAMGKVSKNELKKMF